MLVTIKRLLTAVMMLSAFASIFITLGTLNGRVPGGLTLQNLPWSIAVGLFAGSTVILIVLKLLAPAFDDNQALH